MKTPQAKSDVKRQIQLKIIAEKQRELTYIRHCIRMGARVEWSKVKHFKKWEV